MYLGDSSAHADLHRAALHNEATQHRLLREARSGRRRWWERLFLRAWRPLANMHTDRRRSRRAARNATLLVLGALLANAAMSTASASSDGKTHYAHHEAASAARLQSGYQLTDPSELEQAQGARAVSPSTGTSPWTWLVGAGLVLAAGAAALTIRRRSRRPDTPRVRTWSIPSTHPWDAAAAQYSTTGTTLEGEVR